MKILVIRFSSLGDVILTTALLPNLRALKPAAQVTFLTRTPYATLFEGNPHIDRVMTFDRATERFGDLMTRVRNEKFDVIIDLHASTRSTLLRWLSKVPKTIVVKKSTWARRALVWFKYTSPSLRKSVREKILDCLTPLGIDVIHTETALVPKNVDETLKKFSLPAGKTLIGIAPGAKHNTKRWSPDGFATFANRFGDVPNALIVIMGDKPDITVAAEVEQKITVPCINLAGKTSLAESIAVMSKLSLLLTNDSGLMHMGEALKIPLVTLFGPTVRAFGFAPYRKTSRVVEVVNLSCRPCTLHGQESCPLGHHNCMKDIDPEAVLFSASTVFSGL